VILSKGVRSHPTVAYKFSSNAMSLPGLELTQPSAEREFAPAPPSQINLTPGSEWRFEVAFETTVRVKVSFVFALQKNLKSPSRPYSKLN
jgi:polyribonucleotide 5'-hydroxyl-kinase